MRIPILIEHRADVDSVIGFVTDSDKGMVVEVRSDCGMSIEQLGQIFGRFGAIVHKYVDGEIVKMEITEFSVPKDFMKDRTLHPAPAS